MTSPYEALGIARRSIKKRGLKTAMFRNIVSDLGSAAAFTAGQYGKAKTAWDEFATGYETVTGEVYDPSGESWWKRTFSKPKGEIRVDDTIYDKENIAKVGRFETTVGLHPEAMLDSDIGKVFQQYKELVAPGRPAPGTEVDEITPELLKSLQIGDDEVPDLSETDTGYWDPSTGGWKNINLEQETPNAFDFYGLKSLKT